ncbi:MAG: hypothetical protein COA90_06765 [Gammaproteobacteria bacterium]|nr:MAG: hypothetical protein COA90_06765 [Gammaproteobacteria bacterium]
MKEKLVLIGNGMAGMRTIDELLKLAPDQYDITVFGAEPHGNYNRIMLSPVLAGDKSIDDIITHPLPWYKENNITLFTGNSISEIDTDNQRVKAEDGTEVDYGKLIIATGSNPFMLPLPGAELEGVISFRDIKDVNVMVETAKNYKRAVVIGGGLLGLEAANGLMIQGMEVWVVHRCNTLMEQQLDQSASDLMRTELEEKGMHFLMEHDTDKFSGTDRVEKIHFKDGTELAIDLVVMAIGVRPNISLAKESGIHCERGIVVDGTLKTYAPNVYAVGECVQFQNQLFGLVAPLYEQAKVCAKQLAGLGGEKYTTSPTATKLKVTGINLFSAGDFTGDESTEALIFKDSTRNIYKKIVLRDNKIIGTVLYGDTKDGNWYFSQLIDGDDISSIREDMLFGQHHVSEA